VSKYRTYDELFFGAWKDVLAAENILPRILRPKLEELGIYLTDEQMARISEQVAQGDRSIDFELDNAQYVKAGLPPDKDGKYALTIDLSEEAERLDRLEEKLPEIIAELIPKFIEQCATELLESIESVRAVRLREERVKREAFRQTVQAIWGEALDGLDMFINLVTEAGSDFADEYRTSSTDEPDYKFQALIGLHARACQMGKEIFTLLSEGFADGAHARWRSLHEVAVIGKFILDHEQGTAERYLLHQIIEAKQGAHEHVNHAERLNEPPPTEDEIAQLDVAYKSLRERFGDSYVNPYGWAAEQLGSKSPKFAEIEKSTGLDHLRPYYKLASYNVHASPRSIVYRLGASPYSSVLVAGPSVFGLADPGQGAVFSLFGITVSLLIYQPAIDRHVRLQVLSKMMEQISEAFARAHWVLTSGEGTARSIEEEE